ncbi:MAG: Rrf2 family transcriptional regulator [Clostridiales Family XIII bacterium]|jgi:Rrf2 family protein|nr:Rrf2 family transcriptional regulator [Clostridiales Family XIII bacterium]
MLITRETDYAIRAIRALSDGNKWTLAEICEKEVVPHQFGYKIMKKLALAGFVIIKRGKDGGYIISEDIKDKTMLDLTGVMETPTEVSPCVIPGYVCEAHKSQGQPCSVNIRMSALQTAINDELRSMNLLQLVSEVKEQAGTA